MVTGWEGLEEVVIEVVEGSSISVSESESNRGNGIGAWWGTVVVKYLLLKTGGSISRKAAAIAVGFVGGVGKNSKVYALAASLREEVAWYLLAGALTVSDPLTYSCQASHPWRISL